MGWPSPYAYQPFPPPGFMPGLAAYFGNFTPPVPTNSNMVPIINRENIERAPDVPGIAHNSPQHRPPQTNAVAGPSQPCCPIQSQPLPRVGTTQRNCGMDSASEDDKPHQKCNHRKGKKKASHQDLIDEEQ
ncbi:hypothetical protein ARMSODRAFT_434338 [Armillaria solidipes]|uniref:Uncharacterized protein n=1 Tax=Armillaria solidipes TaxID=1076256 RepID=A0A2H3BPF4_9AGAR|nr:hypothetical protein ARMSODRAFT_434338 [Armillaria solidipes]